MSDSSKVLVIKEPKQIFSVLSHYNTKDLNLDTPIYQPGYTRPLKQCLLIDEYCLKVFAP